MDDEWAPYAATWDSDPAARLYAGSAFDSLAEVLEAAGIGLAAAEVLDFGSGTGLLTERLVQEGAAVCAMDTSAAMIEVLQAKIADHGWAQVTASTELPDPSERFDLVVCSSVCSFLDDYPAVAGDLANRLRPGGLFVQWDWERPSGQDGDAHGLSRAEVRTALLGAGLASVEVGTGFSVEFEGETMAPLMGYGVRE